VGITTFGQNNHAVRTDRWRYIRYMDGGEELYDHHKDEYEWTNVATSPDHAELKAELAKHFPLKNLPAGERSKVSDNEGDTPERPVLERKKAKGKKSKE
jgi:hypothetical protein